MTLRHPAALTLAFVLITGPVLLSAASDTSDREACIQALQLTPELAETGTYKVRVDACVRTRENLRLSQDRNLRNAIRAEHVQERLTRNSRVMNFRVIGTAPTEKDVSDLRKSVYGNESWLYSAPVARPSRRSIQKDGSVSTKAWRQTNGKLRQERLHEALKYCEGTRAGFHRDNCIRMKLIELGS